MIRTTRLTRRQKVILGLFVLFLFVPGMIGFADKFAMLCRALFTTDDGAYAIIPIVNYLLIACGMLCLFVWAVAHGMFRNIEGPKYDHLDREQRLDEEEGVKWENRT